MPNKSMLIIVLGNKRFLELLFVHLLFQYLPKVSGDGYVLCLSDSTLSTYNWFIEKTVADSHFVIIRTYSEGLVWPNNIHNKK